MIFGSNFPLIRKKRKKSLSAAVKKLRELQGDTYSHKNTRKMRGLFLIVWWVLYVRLKKAITVYHYVFFSELTETNWGRQVFIC